MPDVRYQISADKSFNFDQDVLESTIITLTFNLAGTSPIQSDYNLPWAYNNLPWVAQSYDFQSLSISPNRDTNINQFMSWTEVYTKSTAEENANGYFDVKKSINMPVWRISFWEDNNRQLGTQNIATTKRLRQTWGLSTVTGSLSVKSFNPFSEDPYHLLSTNFANFDGAITNAVTNSSTINGKLIYELSLSWIGGKVDPANIPTYTI